MSRDLIPKPCFTYHSCRWYQAIQLDFSYEHLSIKVATCMYTWQWGMGISSNEQYVVNCDLKPLRFGSIFLCEAIGNEHTVPPFCCLKCYRVIDYSDMHYHVHSSFLLQIYL